MRFTSDSQRMAVFANMGKSTKLGRVGCINKFAARNDDLWNRVMATRSVRRVKATPEIRDEYVSMLGFPFSVQLEHDLKIYPMHDAIAMLLDSADSMNDKQYAQVEALGDRFLSDFGTRFSLKDDVKKLVDIGEFNREFEKDPTAFGVYNYLDDSELRDGDVGVKETTRILAGRLGSDIDKNDPGFEAKKTVINRMIALSYDKPYVREFKFGGETR